MTDILEKPARALDSLADRAEDRGGVAGAVAEDLHADAEFLRKLEPGGAPARTRRRAAGTSRSHERAARGGKRAFLVVGGAFVAGLVLAAFVHWRSLVEPRH